MMPSFAQALALHQAGRLDDAEAAYTALLTMGGPPDPELLRLWGLLRFQRGDIAAAETALNAAVALQPDHPAPRRSLALVLVAAGRQRTALIHSRAAIAMTPADPDLYVELGTTLHQLGTVADAERAFGIALRLAPDHGDAAANLAILCHERGIPGPAQTLAWRALALLPDHPLVLANLSVILGAAGRLTTAERMARRALAVAPDRAGSWAQLAAVLVDGGRIDEALTAFANAELARGAADGVIDSNRIYALTLHPTLPAEALSDACRRWGERQTAATGPRSRRPDPDRDPDRPLRIGYVSGDFIRHPVGWFMAPVLPHHDQTSFAITCYATRRREDDLTRRLKSVVPQWRLAADWDDAGFADAVRQDRIDLLIDLAGHTAGNRLAMFAQRPAPVQATWGGLIGTTGLPAIDWLIADPQEIPETLAGLYSERIARLPHDYVCYAPPDYAPVPGPAPSRHGAPPTFGCFNRLAKLGPAVIALWARLLDAVPEARLLIRTPELNDPDLRQRLAAQFRDQGLTSRRLELAGGAPHRELLTCYAQVDVALDPFPYSGGLTTLEALWMGVPVITLGGTRFCSRHSLSHLTVAGHPEWIADSPDHYVTLAAALITDSERRDALRQRLRAEMAASPLLDGLGFTRNLEALLRGLWKDWCSTPSAR
ncbi:MAG: tetratricopeptide repeat protein [Azospirillaceae bacterium]|nr:tetratricopeptide repeat protein [Azospirillaceae bacterium]